jgi:hypothetical protein
MGFLCTKGRNSGLWSKIPVPSRWELRDLEPITTAGKRISKRTKTGMYKYSFASDLSWKNKTVRIVFEGSMTDPEVKINGNLRAFMHAIPAIGTKFDGPENHGPRGQKNKIGWEWISGVLYFDFSTL